VFSLIGFRAVIELSGESRNPQRDVPRAIIGSIIIVTAIYILLQIAFIGVIPEDQLVHGWSGVVLNGASGPFAAFAMILGLSWLAVILYVDATTSPLGTALVFTASTSRLNVAMSRNRNIPAFIGKVNARGLPVVALLLNLVVGMVLLAPLPAWDELVGIVSSATVLTGGIGALSLIVLRRSHPEIKRSFRLPAGVLIATLAFMSSAMVVYWCGWNVNRTVVIVLAVGLLLLAVTAPFARKKPRDLHMLHGVWLFPYLAGLFVLSWLGDYSGGVALIPSPWGEVGVATWSLLMVPLAVRCGLPRHKSSLLVAAAHEELKGCPGFAKDS
jgi:amino acid transporter